MHRIIISIILFACISINAQETVREALMLKEVDYYQNMNRMGPVEASIIYGNWKAPVEGEKVAMGEDESREWRKIVADSTGWFNERDLRGGYAYIPIQSDQEKVMILEGMGYRFAYFNGQPRTGNMYQYREDWQPWQPNFGFCYLPILLKPGQNDLLVFGARVPRFKVRLHEVSKEIFLNIKDPTLPDLIVGQAVDDLAAVVIVNASRSPITDLYLTATLENGETVRSKVPIIQPLSVRKVGFAIKGTAPEATGEANLLLTLQKENQTLDEKSVKLSIKQPLENQKRAFISDIDGSVQYYGFNPAQNPERFPQSALVLSVHGAQVEAINQSGSYYGKDWAHIVAPTNRRPYGFNWEDWGRIDALEVLDLAQQQYNIDPNRVYLTGHSMGGHGTWHIGALHPDKFAAIGPSAGWLSFWSYRARGQIDLEDMDPMEEMLLRATLQSHTMKMAKNYKQLGIYIIHGENDRSVRADESRAMVAELEKFHKDFVYHEEPEVGHWWDHSDEPGADCVDWPPLFDFFARHARPLDSRQRIVDFQTPNPGVSDRNHWLYIDAQNEIGKMSRVKILYDPGKQRFSGSTENVSRLAFDTANLRADQPVTVVLDSQTVENISLSPQTRKLWFHQQDGRWSRGEAPSPDVKNAARYGVFKDAFKNRMIFVYGTKGTAEENAWAFAKARFDAEHFWYQGNGSVDVVRDVDFDPSAEPNRNVIIYGNANTHASWKALLDDSPVQVHRGKIQIGDKQLTGDDLGSVFIRPRPGSDIASVGVFSGTGVIGMRSNDRRPSFAPGFAYPDLAVFDAGKFREGENGTIVAGFFGPDWQVESGEFVWQDK